MRTDQWAPKKQTKSLRKRKARLDARIKSFNERGAGKVADGMNQPGSENKKK